MSRRIVRSSRAGLHVRGFKEEGTTTTPFDMVVRNDLDRFQLATDVINRVPRLATVGAYAKQAFRDRFIEHRQYIEQYGEDTPEIRDWTWRR
jgi:xylulose-5-phosphate/fructose-6-phosphate phosphoketolase